MGDVSHSGDVEDLETGIAEGLAEEEPGAGANRPAEGLRITGD